MIPNATLVFALATAVSAKVTTFHLSKLCPSTPGGTAYLSLGGVAESFSSTAVIMASSEDVRYNCETNCQLEVNPPPGHHIVASVRRIYLRDECVDNLTIYADNQEPRIFCGLRYDKYETETIAAQGSVIIQFISGSCRDGAIFDETGFQLTVTAYRDAPCNSTTDFSCENNRCIAQELNCSSYNHCGDNSNERCAEVTPSLRNCSSAEFTCSNGKCIDAHSVCDRFDDCGDLSDELNCTHTCGPGLFPCPSGKCIETTYVCDGVNDCGDFSDEANCGNCSISMFACRNGRCIDSDYVCNTFNDCGDWTDEKNCTYSCIDSWQFACKNGNCVHRANRCDKFNDCGDWSDEENCTYPCMIFEFRCNNGSCLNFWKYCNGENDCGDWSDEENCPSTEQPSDTASTEQPSDTGYNRLLWNGMAAGALLLLAICTFVLYARKMWRGVLNR